MKKLPAELRQGKKRGVAFPSYKIVHAALERQLAMTQEHQNDSHLPCQNSTAQNPQSRWGHNGMGAPPPKQLTELTPEPTAHPPRIPSVPPGDNEEAHASEIEGVPPGYVYIHTPLPSAQIFNWDAYAKDHKRDRDFIPNFLTDEGTSTG